MFNKLLTFIALFLFSISSNAATKLGLGIGLATGQSPYKGVSTNENLLPAYITYESERFYFRGVEGGYYFWQQPKAATRLRAAILAKGRIEGYSISDSRVFSGMQSRDWSLDAGVMLLSLVKA